MPSGGPWRVYFRFRAGRRCRERPASAIRISRQTWQGLLDELAQARRQRQLVTYRALIEAGERQPDDAIRRALARVLQVPGWEALP